VTGIEQAAAEPCLPFFIEWADEVPLPGRASVTHPAGSAQIAELRLDGDADRVTAWLGGHRLPLAVRPGAPALAGTVLIGGRGRWLVCG
jgi:hypothetical protein